MSCSVTLLPERGSLTGHRFVSWQPVPDGEILKIIIASSMRYPRLGAQTGLWKMTAPRSKRENARPPPTPDPAHLVLTPFSTSWGIFSLGKRQGGQSLLAPNAVCVQIVVEAGEIEKQKPCASEQVSVVNGRFHGGCLMPPGMLWGRQHCSQPWGQRGTLGNRCHTLSSPGLVPGLQVNPVLSLGKNPTSPWISARGQGGDSACPEGNPLNDLLCLLPGGCPLGSGPRCGEPSPVLPDASPPARQPGRLARWGLSGRRVPSTHARHVPSYFRSPAPPPPASHLQTRK